jgi:hypothetical protein
MKQRNTFFIALSMLLLAVIAALFKHQTSAVSPANSSAATNGAGMADPPDDSAKSAGSRRERAATKRNEMMAAQLEVAEIGRNHTAAVWVYNAEVAFEKTNSNLATDLGLSAEQAAKVDALFVSRKEQLAGMLASLKSDETEDPQETVRQITALMRNKGLRDGLAGILTSEQLATFDAAEANQQRKSIQAKTDRDMATINTVLTLTDPEKQKVLDALSTSAVEKAEEEADARAFMSLAYGEMAAKIDLSNVRGLAAMLNPDLNDRPGFAYGSPEYFRWREQQRAERIERGLSPLRYVLNKEQLARYREHLEAEPAR